MTLANDPSTSMPSHLDPSHQLPSPARQQAAPKQEPPKPINVGQSERIGSAIGGVALALLGLRRRSVPGLIAAGIGGSLIYRGMTGHCSVYEALGKNTADETDGARPQEYSRRGIHVVQSFTINKPRAELYRFWRNFENLPRFMSHLKRVQVIDERRSHWVADAPAGRTVEWDAEIINDEPDHLIAWRSLGGADVDNAGSVRFTDAPADRGTEVKVTLDYIPPGGSVGAALAWLFGKSGQLQVRDDLRHFKQLMEAGEIPTTEGQPRGTCGK